MLSISWKQTRKHQSNASLSKATFGFSKDKRFRQKIGTICDSFYNIPSSLGKAPASGIGKGSKTQMVNSSALKLTPSPQNYHVKSDFQLTKRGIKFGLGRENIKYNGIFQKSQTPEPGHYHTLNSFPSKRGFTIYEKLAMPKLSNSKNPGPAQYTTPQSFNCTGRYILSQLTNCPGYKIKPSQHKNTLVLTPGPNQYEPKGQNINALGRYNNSKHENSRCRTFSKSSKTMVKKQQTPGPNAYNKYSQFGLKS